MELTLSHWESGGQIMSEKEKMYLYVMHAEKEALIKIGITNDPHKRLLTIQSACPYHLKLLHEFEINKYKAIENRFHLHFRHTHMRGEWFRATPYMLEHFNNCVAKDGEIFDESRSFDDWLFNCDIHKEITKPDNMIMHTARAYSEEGNYNAVEYIIGELEDTIRIIHCMVPKARRRK
ncbi:hypothetical protein LCGC14_1482270 [marine sediment metagenome]|uniref:GIY-YIG domain-containing protein n=1 Tax=marine sediment metagenome TaxID=412755 RepID=A0A0F9MB19_9ZZZZ